MSLSYAYEGNKIKQEVYAHYVDMCNDAKGENGYILITTSSYRDYDTKKAYIIHIKAVMELRKLMLILQDQVILNIKLD
jgi:hypothetical protein